MVISNCSSHLTVTSCFAPGEISPFTILPLPQVEQEDVHAEKRGMRKETTAVDISTTFVKDLKKKKASNPSRQQVPKNKLFRHNDEETNGSSDEAISL